ncbi:MAG: hypothetical protein HYX29_09590, partial [Solirubrobacterales bacterium]|nr:hypothetical protein [Solirubrobacterales bacterium]
MKALATGNRFERFIGASFVLCVVLLMTAVFAPAANADPTCTVTWDGGGPSSNWNEAQNWDADQVPGEDDVACLGGDSAASGVVVNSTVSISAIVAARPVTVSYPGSVNFTDGSLTSTFNTLNVNGGGAIAGSGDQVILPGGSFGLNGGTLDGDGSLTVSPGASMS